MTLKAKHIVEEINGTRCSIVEKGATADRIDFLKKLLEFNKFEVFVAEEALVEGSPALFTIGVTDLVFNPVIAVYEMVLKTSDGKKVSPAYWNQYSTECVDEYWDFVK
ncbi:MAG: hypothetical protein NTY07_21835 [Bacteroidia bacterium]|nr:hypothetical protein [Bacteroidia bacterium]